MGRFEDVKYITGRQFSDEQDKPVTINLDIEKNEKLSLAGYAPVKWRVICLWILTLLTVGLIQLLFYWRRDWSLKFTHKQVSLSDAKDILIKDRYRRTFVSNIKEEHIFPSSDDQKDVEEKSNIRRIFVHEKVKYIWDSKEEKFAKVKWLRKDIKCSEFYDLQPLETVEAIERLKLFGKNAIDVHVTPILKLFFTQIFNPFYVFQIFSVILWFNDEYYYYASCIIVISGVSIIAFIRQTRQIERRLKNMIPPMSVVTVCRGKDNQYQEIMSDDLVPGDIIEIPKTGFTMPCDAVLINGNCIVNESMLTGESVPVTKIPLPNLNSQRFNFKDHSKHSLFCGTKIIQARYFTEGKVKAIVLKTGFTTMKGKLIRSILFPKPINFKFTQDSYKFVMFLAIIAASGMIFTLVIMVRRGETVKRTILRTLDLITVVIPPALPAALTIGIGFAQSRLKKSNIFCISPSNINMSGSVDCCCFDKTGTLTEDGMDLKGVLPCKNSKFNPSLLHTPSSLERSPLLCALATCHSLTIINTELSGDPLDLKMFESINWDLEEVGEDSEKYDMLVPTIVKPRANSNENQSDIPYEIGILRQMVFSSRLQRMSVVTRTLGKNQFTLFTKGSPEMLYCLCSKESLPKDFYDVLYNYTKRGYRVLALAYKELGKMSYVKVQKCAREELEKDLIFLGFLIMENRLKIETEEVIRELHFANFKTLMITGDNMLTALSVARDCSMISDEDEVYMVHVTDFNGEFKVELAPVDERKDEKDQTVLSLRKNVRLAITGKSWNLARIYCPELLNSVCVRGVVFARMLPEQKVEVVETLQKLDYYVSMCGDGANDSSALKMAHAGISLSEGAEASVAAPFTSKEMNIKCVPRVIKEGRAALVTSFGIFKFMACYSLTQFTSVTILYWIGANFSDFQYLYIDLGLLTTLSITYGYTKAYTALVPLKPDISLFSLTSILSIIVQVIILISTQLSTWFFLKSQPWFTPYKFENEENYICDENTAVFLISSFQYISSAIVFSKSRPFRQPIYTNYAFVINILLALAMNVFLTLFPPANLQKFMGLQIPPFFEFRFLYLGIALASFILCYLLEAFVVSSELLCKRIEKKIHEKLAKPTEYTIVENKFDKEWKKLPLSNDTLVNVLNSELSTRQRHASNFSNERSESYRYAVENDKFTVDILDSHIDTTLL